jgi:cytochrome P450
MKTNRKDFMTRMLEVRDPELVSDIQLAAHASDFVLAGSETTATALSCITYYLLHTPEVLKKLQHEIRTMFKSYEQINAAATAPLTYLNAVALEGLRVYPPLPLALPRVVPEGGDTVDAHPLPAGVGSIAEENIRRLTTFQTIVSTSPVASSMDPSNFVKPEKFIPERWLNATTKDAKDASQPFSLGPRGCLGRK